MASETVQMTVPRRLVESVTHERASAYLLARGWKCQGEGHGTSVWLRGALEPGVWVPQNSQFGREQEVLATLLVLSELEGRSQAEVALAIGGMTWEEACRRG